MKLSKIILFIFVLPITLFLDLILYAFVKTCPTCGRTKIQLIELAKLVQEGLKNVNKPITVAIMGCAVNGPGEARQSDIGIAGGAGEALLFKKGEIIRKVKEEDIVKTLLDEIEKM